MAEKVQAPEGKAKRKSKAKPADGPGIGHNITAIREKAEPIFERLAKLKEQQLTSAAEYRNDFKDLYERGSNEIGCSRKVLRREFNRYYAKVKEEQEDMELEAAEREEIENLRAALDGTPFGTYVAGELAKMRPQP